MVKQIICVINIFDMKVSLYQGVTVTPRVPNKRVMYSIFLRTTIYVLNKKKTTATSGMLYHSKFNHLHVSPYLGL